MVINIRKTDKKIERKERPKEQQDALAGGELPSPDYVPAPTQEESMDMFRRQRAKDIQDSGGRTPQSEKSIMTRGGQSAAVMKMHLKTMRDMGYDEETIQANMPNNLMGQLNEMETRQEALKKMGMPVDQQDIMDIRNERQKLEQLFFSPINEEEPRMKKIEEEIRTGKPAREPATSAIQTLVEDSSAYEVSKDVESGRLQISSKELRELDTLSLKELKEWKKKNGDDDKINYLIKDYERALKSPEASEYKGISVDRDTEVISKLVENKTANEVTGDFYSGKLNLSKSQEIHLNSMRLKELKIWKEKNGNDDKVNYLIKDLEKELKSQTGRDPASRLTNTEKRRQEFESGKMRLDSIYYPAGHEKAGELTQHGAQMWSEIQQDSLLDAPKTKEPNGKK